MAAKYITKGRQVLVEGRVETSEKGRFNVIAVRVVFGLPSVTKTQKTDEK